MLAMGTGGIVALAIVLVLLVVLFFFLLGRARRTSR
jgi:preprotein translocase subunit YajC